MPRKAFFTVPTAVFEKLDLRTIRLPAGVSLDIHRHEIEAERVLVRVQGPGLPDCCDVPVGDEYPLASPAIMERFGVPWLDLHFPEGS